MSALTYNKKQNYSPEQITQLQGLLGIDQSGEWTCQTVNAVIRWQRMDPELSPDGKVGPATLAKLEALASGSAEVKLAEPSIITTVGAWVGHHSFAQPGEDVDFCVRNNINRLDIIVNDFARKRAYSPFSTHTVAKIVELSQRAKAAGVEVHLMSWLMPHAQFISDAAEQLLALCERVEPASLQWDIEEPWHRAVETQPHANAAAQVREAFAALPCPMGLNAIGFAPVETFAPIAEVCDYMVPQCFATAKSKATPEGVVSTSISRWHKELQIDKPTPVGLAAFRQSGIVGHTPASAMGTCVDAVRAYGVDSVIYWSLRWIKESPEIAGIIAALRSEN